jgi:hypothetical protein
MRGIDWVWLRLWKTMLTIMKVNILYRLQAILDKLFARALILLLIVLIRGLEFILEELRFCFALGCGGNDLLSTPLACLERWAG